MELKEIKELIDYCEKSKLTSFEYIENNNKIAFCKHQNVVVMSSSNSSYETETGTGTVFDNINLDLKVHAAEYMSTQENIYESSGDMEKEGQGYDNHMEIIRSPYVGVISFPEHVKETGEALLIKKGDLLCVIEAMKIYNDITSPFNGVIVDIMVDDYSLVEFDQPIMKIKVDVHDKTIQEDIDC